MSYPSAYLVEITECNKRPIAMIIVARNNQEVFILAQYKLPEGYTSQCVITIKGSCNVDQIGNCVVVIL